MHTSLLCLSLFLGDTSLFLYSIITRNVPTFLLCLKFFFNYISLQLKFEAQNFSHRRCSINSEQIDAWKDAWINESRLLPIIPVPAHRSMRVSFLHCAVDSDHSSMPVHIHTTTFPLGTKDSRQDECDRTVFSDSNNNFSLNWLSSSQVLF